MVILPLSLSQKKKKKKERIAGAQMHPITLQ